MRYRLKKLFVFSCNDDSRYRIKIVIGTVLNDSDESKTSIQNDNIT